LAVNTYLSTREAADLLGVSLRTVQLWVESGTLRAWKTAGGHRRIPLESVNALLRERAASIGEPVPGVGYDILLIEDDPVQVELVRGRLETLALPVPVRLRVSMDGYLGLIALGEAMPDLLLLDLHLPRLDGFQLLATLRASSVYAELPILVVSALSPAEVAARGGLPTGVMMLQKPLNPMAFRQHLLDLMPGRTAIHC